MICVPIIGPTMSRALEDIQKASEVADIIELRLDLIDDVNLADLLKAVDKPVRKSVWSKMTCASLRIAQKMTSLNRSY